MKARSAEAFFVERAGKRLRPVGVGLSGVGFWRSKQVRKQEGKER